jgi:hypothetical protein
MPPAAVCLQLEALGAGNSANAAPVYSQPSRSPLNHASATPPDGRTARDAQWLEDSLQPRTCSGQAGGTM